MRLFTATSARRRRAGAYSARCRPLIPPHAGRGFRGMSAPSVEVIPSRG